MPPCEVPTSSAIAQNIGTCADSGSRGIANAAAVTTT